LALLDWNRDGRIDLLANHLDQPIALLQNESSAGNWLQLELVGVTSERDAVGAEVRVEADGKSWCGWQTGGDGLMCTNEAMIHLGMDDVTAVEKIEVHWPGGTTQVLESVQPNQRYLIIEGVDEPHRR
jgi:hypothetical protein